VVHSSSINAAPRCADADRELSFAEERLTVLQDRYDRRLLYFVRRVLGETEEAFDVVQSVWLHVHRKLPTLGSPAAFRVWLYRIAHAQALSVLRRQSRQPVVVDHVSDDELAEDRPGEGTFADAERVHAALGGLSVDHRRVLTLRFLEDMTIEDIAAVLECSPGTVKSRLHYAKAALRIRIKEQDHD
jgi:RNA polymerase sigma-70 factor, ECF subfamily